MRTIQELINTDEPAWPTVQHWAREVAGRVELLPVNPLARDAALVAVQVKTRSPMGAVVYETGGIFIDHGWIRLLGSGHPRLPRTLFGWNEGRTTIHKDVPAELLLVADDVLGGVFALSGGALPGPPGRIHYFAPDTLMWEPLDMSYSDFIYWAFTGDLSSFYEPYR